jgi:hypothetical protein
MSPPDGTPQQNHDVGRVMVSLHPSNCLLHLTGCLTINLVILAVVLHFSGEDSLVHEDNGFVPVLGMPLEEMICSCLLDLLQNRSKEVTLQLLLASHV